MQKSSSPIPPPSDNEAPTVSEPCNFLCRCENVVCSIIWFDWFLILTGILHQLYNDISDYFLAFNFKIQDYHNGHLSPRDTDRDSGNYSSHNNSHHHHHHHHDHNLPLDDTSSGIICLVPGCDGSSTQVYINLHIFFQHSIKSKINIIRLN